ncbi:MAG: GntR family transcriptional regulator [Spirochaetaceae bacterium]
MSEQKELTVDYKSIIPVYEQIKQFFKLQILNGHKSADEKITSVRELARTIMVNQNTIVKAYYQLEQEGFIYSKPGRGYFVKEVVKNRESEKLELLNYITKDYLEKVTEMGFSVDDVLTLMKKLK